MLFTRVILLFYMIAMVTSKIDSKDETLPYENDKEPEKDCLA
jgi:hypothetical protein